MAKKHKPEPQTRKAAAKYRSPSGIVREIRTLEQAVHFIASLEEFIMAVDQRILDAQASLDTKLADLNTKVDAFIASHGASSEADVQAIVDKTNAEAAAVDALGAKLTPPA